VVVITLALSNQGGSINLLIVVWLVVKSTTSHLTFTYITHLDNVWDNLTPLSKDTLEKMPKWFRPTKSLKEMEAPKPSALWTWVPMVVKISFISCLFIKELWYCFNKKCSENLKFWEGRQWILPIGCKYVLISYFTNIHQWI
jgi:hypothetical protein